MHRARRSWRVILLQLRLPRVLGAALAGACFAGAGQLLQTATGNDLAAKGVQGQRIGALLRLALQNVISGKWENHKDTLLCELEKNNW